jgi:hypothetical protein
VTALVVYNRCMNSCGEITNVEFAVCPKCDKPIAILRGHEDGKPIAMVTHRVDPKVIVPR